MRAGRWRLGGRSARRCRTNRADPGRLRAVLRPARGCEKARRGVDGRLAGLGSPTKRHEIGAQSSSRASAGPVHRGDGWRRSEGRGFGRLRAGGPCARRPISGRLTRTRQPGSRRPTFAAGRSADRGRATVTGHTRSTERETALHAPAAVLERLTKKLASWG